MAYTPNMYFPNNYQPNWNYQPTITTQPMMPQQQMPTQQPQASPVIYVIPVKSLLEAKEYKEQPGTEPPLFMLDNQPVFIKKEKDEQGGEKFSAYRFTEIPLSDIMPNEGNFVTKDYLDEKLNKIMEAINGKPVAQSDTTAIPTAG